MCPGRPSRTLLRGLIGASVWDQDYQQALDEAGDEGYATDKPTTSS
jgi:hypothetical protein